MTVAAFNTAIAAAVTAIEAGDNSTAVMKLRAAKVLLLGLPDSVRGSNQLRWDRGAFDQMIADMSKAVTAATGIQESLVTYARPST